jgi:ATP-binding cassette subfamily B protein
MTWVMILSVGIVLLTIIATFIIAVPKYRVLQKLVDRLNLVSREMLTGLRVIRAFNRGTSEEKKFDQSNTDLTKINLFVNRVMVVLMPIMFGVMNFTMLAVVWYGSKQIDLGNLQIGEMVAFMQYAMQAIFAFLMITMVFIMVPRASVSLGRIAEVLNTDPTIVDPKDAKNVEQRKGGKVDFDHVTFSYSGAEAPILHDVSFTALPGQTTAIVGSTGSGKSTLINLIPRFYDATSGSVKIDDTDVKEMKMEDVYHKIGYVPQKGILFSGTVESNLKYGAPNASDDEVRHAAEIAQAKDFINELDGGFNAPIAQGGTNVSGGQKQRLSIARAIIRKPEIYIFDDSFSALDFTTDAKLRAALESETKGKTVLIVAQRISTIRNADSIVVLNEGRVVGQGTHDQLMKTCDVYREIALSQLSEAELSNSAPTLTPVTA